MTAISFGFPAPEEFSDEISDLVELRAASRLAAKDSSLWGESAAEEAAQRLGWVDLPSRSAPLLDEIAALRGELLAEGLDVITLAGMGGSSLAPEVICASARVPLEVVDTSDPGQIAEAIGTDLSRTVLIVSSKSGSTVETDSQRRAFAAAFTAAGIDPATRMIAITDPGSSLHDLAVQEGYRRVFLADPQVGGRFSAFSAFGLVPAGLAGADVRSLVADAARIAQALGADSPDNPAVRLGAFLGTAHARGVEKLVIAETTDTVRGLGSWLEQLLAESTGKDGRGILPIVVEGPDAPGFADAGADAMVLFIGPAAGGHQPVSGLACSVDEPLGAQLLLWEHAVAIAGYSLGINPFDQPDVEDAKARARHALGSAGAGTSDAPSFVSGAVEVHGETELLGGADSLTGALQALVDSAPGYGYLAIQAFLDRIADAHAESMRAALAQRTGIQVAFGFGPRYLHSTGQYHKGGHPNGVFLQLTADCRADLLIPGRDFSFAGLQRAQAAGDAQSLRERGRPVLRLHLRDRTQGIEQVLEAITRLRPPHRDR